MPFLVREPVGILFRSLHLDLKDFFKSITNLAISTATQNYPAVARDLAASVSAVGLSKDPGQIAWLLIVRSLGRAISELIQAQFRGGVKQRPADIDSLCYDLAKILESKQVILDKRFFERPAEFSFVAEFQELLIAWLKAFSIEQAQASSIAGRLPSFFAQSLDVEWRERSSDYLFLKDIVESPFTKAADEERAWLSYCYAMERDIDEPVFNEPFGLSQVYVWPRAYYEEKVIDQDDTGFSRSLEPKIQLRLVWLKEHLLKWCGTADERQAIRVISGDPGSGKSCFTRMFSAALARIGQPSLRIPLHHLDLEKTWDAAIKDYTEQRLGLSLNPLNPGTSRVPLVVIFDGLDELSQQGRKSEDVVKGFLNHVIREVRLCNERMMRVLVLISGRDLVVRANQSDFREAGQLLHLIPYCLDGEERPYIGKQELLKLDQRHEWWHKYGTCTGANYTRCPYEIMRGEIGNITHHPLLNYLVAAMHREGLLSDIGTNTNRNVIYEALLTSVYKRDWEPGVFHPALGPVGMEDFKLILEEIAVAAWHGDGRCATVREIEERCRGRRLERLLEAYQEKAKSGITQLLSAFYFRHSGYGRTGDETFEFTHKSFGEYLSGMRIVRELERIDSQFRWKEKDPDLGWDAIESLSAWIYLCGPRELDEYIFKFIADEVRLKPSTTVRRWQKNLIRLIEHTVVGGTPMERTNPRPSYHEEARRARNAELALLACHSACARVTRALSIMSWPSPGSFREWMDRLRLQPWDEGHFPLTLLNGLDLANQNLMRYDLAGADLSNSRLLGAELGEAHLRRANLREAKLEGANLRGANLREAILEGATLTRASLCRAHLGRAKLRGGYFGGTDFEGANLVDAEVSRVDLKGAKVDRVNLHGVKWQK